jgi:hypothetical protein
VHPNRLLDPLDLNTPNSHEKINVKDLPDFESLNRVKITLAAPLVPVCASFIFVVFFSCVLTKFAQADKPFISALFCVGVFVLVGKLKTYEYKLERRRSGSHGDMYR